MRSCRRRRKRIERQKKKRKTHRIWRHWTPTSGRAPPPAANPLKEWGLTDFLLISAHFDLSQVAHQKVHQVMNSFWWICFSYRPKFVWRTWRSLPCVLLPGTWPSSAGWPGTAGAWRKACTPLTTCTWRRRTARGWEPPVLPHADCRSLCPFESLFTVVFFFWLYKPRCFWWPVEKGRNAKHPTISSPLTPPICPRTLIAT